MNKLNVEIENSEAIVDMLIPARNEAMALPLLLEELPRDLIRKVILVNNGSTDRTAEIAAEAGCIVVDCPTPGYGRACLAGLAVMAQDPPQIVVFLDADRSDRPEHLPQLLAPILAGRADLVLGSRTLGQAERGSLTLTQRFGNALATFLMRMLWGTRFTDLAPFRAISWNQLKIMGMQDKNFGWTIEMQIKAVQHGLRIEEVPVNYRNRIGVSKISGTFWGSVRAGYKILYTIAKYRLAKS